jgi:hypothetical protein
MGTDNIRLVFEPFTKPLLNIDLDNQPFWEGLREHKFLLFRCMTCGAYYWPKAYCRFHDNESFMGNWNGPRRVEKGRCLRLTSITGLCTPALKKTFLTSTR